MVERRFSCNSRFYAVPRLSFFRCKLLKERKFSIKHRYHHDRGTGFFENRFKKKIKEKFKKKSKL